MWLRVVLVAVNTIMPCVFNFDPCGARQAGAYVDEDEDFAGDDDEDDDFVDEDDLLAAEMAADSEDDEGDNTPREDEDLLAAGTLQASEGPTRRRAPQAKKDWQDDSLTNYERELAFQEQLNKALKDCEDEKRKNAETHAALRGTPVMYGKTVIQLRHVKTGKFVTYIPKQLAKKEKNSSRVCLDPVGSTKSHVIFLPMFGVRRQTESIGSGELIKLVFVLSKWVTIDESAATGRERGAVAGRKAAEDVGGHDPGREEGDAVQV